MTADPYVRSFVPGAPPSPEGGLLLARRSGTRERTSSAGATIKLFFWAPSLEAADEPFSYPLWTLIMPAAACMSRVLSVWTRVSLVWDILQSLGPWALVWIPRAFSSPAFLNGTIRGLRNKRRSA